MKKAKQYLSLAAMAVLAGALILPGRAVASDQIDPGEMRHEERMRILSAYDQREQEKKSEYEGALAELKGAIVSLQEEAMMALTSAEERLQELESLKLELDEAYDLQEQLSQALESALETEDAKKEAWLASAYTVTIVDREAWDEWTGEYDEYDLCCQCLEHFPYYQSDTGGWVTDWQRHRIASDGACYSYTYCKDKVYVHHEAETHEEMRYGEEETRAYASAGEVAEAARDDLEACEGEIEAMLRAASAIGGRTAPVEELIKKAEDDIDEAGMLYDEALGLDAEQLVVSDDVGGEFRSGLETFILDVRNAQAVYEEEEEVYREAILIYGNGYPYEAHFTVMEGRAPTCLEEGLTEGIYCLVCDEVISPQESIEKTPHQSVKQITKAEPGRSGKITYVCRACQAVTGSEVISRPYKVSLPSRSYVYTGTRIRPKVLVYDSQGNLIDASAYTVTYEDNKRIGTARVLVSFSKSSRYQGTMTKTFKIVPIAPYLRSVLRAGKGEIKAGWVRVGKASGYQLQWSYRKDFKKAKKVTIGSRNKTAKTISGLRSSKTVYVRVRSVKMVNGVKYYSKWSNVRKVLP